MFSKKIEELVKKYLDGTATPEEREQLDTWYRNRLLKTKEWEADSLDEVQQIKHEMFGVISKRISDGRSRRLIPYLYRYVAAAALLFVILSVTFIYNYKGSTNLVADNKEVLSPGVTGAVLTLATGEKVVLGKNALSRMPQAGSAIGHCGDSILEYKNTNGSAAKKIAYNTLTTPNGHKFTLVLSDGTKVYMNAGSALQYPESFAGPERLVKLTGEAYFEVAHDSKSPFRVQVRNQMIEDIGTSFNVYAYADESFTSVTLVEGSVKVKTKVSEAIITPGQKATTTDGSNQISVKTADLESELAWRSDLFHFEDAQLSAVLKQISRWYDLEIEYEGAIPSKTINGEIYRNMNGKQILSILKNLGVNYTLEGRKLIIKSE
ncbi:MAG: fec operon regulator FecR [Bacteroidetes bacterium]|nr:fec operon regulator FecR [Bacteroidota bacterium]